MTHALLPVKCNFPHKGQLPVIVMGVSLDAGVGFGFCVDFYFCVDHDSASYSETYSTEEPSRVWVGKEVTRLMLSFACSSP